AGFTHVETENWFANAIPVVATLARPLNARPELLSPVLQVAPLTVPLYPLPDESCVTAPVPSSKVQYPIKPWVGAAAVGLELPLLAKAPASWAVMARLYKRPSSTPPCHPHP